MSITKTLRASALAASLAIALGMALTPTPAAAAGTTGSTTFSVILQPTTLLYYYSAIDLTVPSSALVALAGGATINLGAQALTATGTASTLSANAATIAPGAPGSISAVGLTLGNVWAVRSITTPSSGTTTVTVSFGTGSTAVTSATLKSPTTGSSIALSSLATSPTSFNGTGLGGTPRVGNITMTMDLSNASTAATYSGATIYITATST